VFNKWALIFFKWTAIALSTVLIVLLIVILLIRTSWGQDLLANKATQYLSGKLETTVEIEKLRFNFKGDILMDNFYMEDQQGDTLIFSKELIIGVSPFPLIFNNKFILNDFYWRGLVVNVHRKIDVFNYEFITDAFSSADDPNLEIKESTSPKDNEPLKVVIKDEIRFENIQLRFLDGIDGMEGEVKLGLLTLKIPNLSIEDFQFDIQDLLIQNTQVHWLQTKALESEENEEELPAFFLKLNNFKIQGLVLDYQNDFSQQKALLNVADFSVKKTAVSSDELSVSIHGIDLKDSKIHFEDFSVDENSSIDDSSQTFDFQWPELRVEIKDLNFSNNEVSYQTVNRDFNAQVFESENLWLKQFNLQIPEISYFQNSAQVQLSHFSFQEGSGFVLNDIQMDLTLNDKDLAVNKFILQTPKSEVITQLHLGYTNIQELIEMSPNVTFNWVIGDLKFDLNDVISLDQKLANDPLFQILKSHTLNWQHVIQGTLNNLNIQQLSGSLGEEMHWDLSANLQNILSLDRLKYDVQKLNFNSKGNLLQQLGDAFELNRVLPKDINWTAELNGGMKDLKIESLLLSDLGNLAVKGAFDFKQGIQYQTEIEIEDLQTGILLANKDFGKTSLTIHSKGQGVNEYRMNADFLVDFEVLEMYQKDFSGLHLEGNYLNSMGSLKAFLQTNALNFDFNTDFTLDSIQSIAAIDFNLNALDLQAFNLTENNLNTKFNFHADFSGNLEEFEFKSLLQDARIIKNGVSYSVTPIDLLASSNRDTTTFMMHGDFIHSELHANLPYQQLISSLQNHFNSYLDSAQMVNVDSMFVVDFNLKIQPTAAIQEVFFPQLVEMDTLTFEMRIDEVESKMNAFLTLPSVIYGEYHLDSLAGFLSGNQGKLDFGLAFKGFDWDPVGMGLTQIVGDYDVNTLGVELKSMRDNDVLLQVASKIEFLEDNTRIQLKPDALIFQGNTWNIPNDNLVIIGEDFVKLNQLEFSYLDQELFFTDQFPGITDPHLATIFKNFDLNVLSSFLNSGNPFIGGLVNGNFIVENPLGGIGFIADLEISDVLAMEVPLGNLSMNASSPESGVYEGKILLSGGGIDFDLEGNFMASEEASTLHAEARLNSLDMASMAPFLEGNLSNPEGILKGNVSVSGTTASPDYFGNFYFENVSFLVDELNSKLIFKNEKITFDTKGLFFDQFMIRDAGENEFNISGAILTEKSMINPDFDLKMVANNFQLINSSSEDNQLFYGKGILDAEIEIRGNLELPEVFAKLNVESGTDLTFVVPESQLDLVEREGVVRFVDKTLSEELQIIAHEEHSTGFSGIDLRAIIAVDSNAVFKVIIDERSGDNLQISGKGDLNLGMNPNGLLTMSGFYEVNSGHYEMSLYNLVNRKFNIGRGSRIQWNGDPMDAEMNISAIYALKTSPAEIMATQISGANAESRNQFRRELPFLVFLNLEGPLLRPEISFKLDMPEDQKGFAGGNIFARVSQINEQEDELNKQVFSLLVLNQFFPMSGSDGSGGGTTAMARNSVSQLLSSQLNAFSQNLLGNSGVELDFDLDSFQDFESGQGRDRTQLNVNARTRLMDDRLIVQVGSQMDVEGANQSTGQAGAMLGNVSAEYLLTENGRYRLRAFRRNQFESIIDGQLIVTGLGVIFNREFNRFVELWKGIDLTENKSNPIEQAEAEERENGEAQEDKNVKRKKKGVKND
jgi:translocation and assembly module TamB